MITEPPFDLYDFEGQLEPGIAAALLFKLTGSAPVQRDTDVLKVPRIEAKLTVHNAEEHFYIVPNTNPVLMYQDVWNGSVRLRIVTNRARKKGSRSHAAMRGGVRWLMQNHKEYITPNLTFHKIIWTLESGTQCDVNNDKEDVSEVSFQLKWGIKHTAFPTS